MPRSIPLPVALLAGYALLCTAAGIAIEGLGADHALFGEINAGADAALPDPLLTSATILGHALCAVMLLAPALVRAPQLLAAGLLAALPASLLSWLPKHLVTEPRPAAILASGELHIHGARLASSTSFPSGHSITVFAVVAAVLCASTALRTRSAATVLAACALLVAGSLAAASRVAVGAHWPIDVLGGAVLGMLSGAIGAAWSRRWTFWRRRSGALAMAAIVAGCALALVFVDTGYPSARPLQYALAALGLVSALFGFAFHLRQQPA